jgi:electron transport complex protein RnfA
MEKFKSLIVILLSSVLVNNYVLSRFLGICPFLGVSKKLDQATGMGISVTAVMLLATAVTWPIQKLILDPLGLGYMQTILFILVIAALVQIIEIALQKLSPKLYQALGIYLPLITTNCAVLGAATINANADRSILDATLFGCFSGMGFALALVLFSSLRERLDLAAPPRSCAGTPIALITAGILAMAFIGFSGLC